MSRARRLCTADPRCPNLSDGGPCAIHRRRLDAARGTSRARGYVTAWDRFTKDWLALHRWCGERADFRLHAAHSQCVQRGERTLADVTDHIRALQFGGARFDPANLQSLCGACNRRKAIALEGSFTQVR